MGTCTQDDHSLHILDVEHNAIAGRIIIRYFIDRPSQHSQGWLYIEDACAYRGVCDNQWICMTPNVGHPLHSSTVVNAGVHYFVWDYHGVGGLDLDDFTSETSFLVQLALQDSGCDWVDPCEQSTCVTPPTADPPGVDVEGEAGTQGNCGPGYLIVLDANGCPCCDLVNPCELPENINYVPGECSTAGDPVEGDVGTQGNCCKEPDCSAYGIIYLDDNGCPYCQETDFPGGGGGATPGPPSDGIGGEPFDPPGGGGGNEPGPPADGIGGDIFDDGGGGGVTIDNGGTGIPTEPGQPGGPGGPDWGPGPPADDIGGDWFGDDEGGGHTNPGPPADGWGIQGQHNTVINRNGPAWFNSNAHTYSPSLFGAADVPYNQTTLDSGPKISYNTLPYSSTPISPGGSYVGSNVSGELISQFANTRPDDGAGTYGSDASAVIRSKAILHRGPFGGKIADFRTFNHFRNNQNYSRNIQAIINPINPAPVVKETNITTRHFYPQVGPITNSIPGSTAPTRGKTSISDAIYIKNSIAYIQYPQNFRSIYGILKKDNVTLSTARTAIESTNSPAIRADVRGAKKNITKQGGARRKLLGTSSIKPRSSYGSRSGINLRKPSNNLAQSKNIDKVKDIKGFKNNISFANQNRVHFNVVPGRGVAIGAKMFCSAIAVPIVHGKQTFSMGIFLRDKDGRIVEVASSPNTTSTYRRHVATDISTAGLSPGPAHVILYIFDSKDNPIHRETKSIELYNSGALAGYPDKGVGSEKLSVTNDDTVSALASVSKNQIPLRLPIGSADANRSIMVFAEMTATHEDTDYLPITVLTKHHRGPVNTHYISVWKDDIIPLFDDQTGNRSTWKDMLPNAWSGTALAKAQNNSVVDIGDARYTGVLHKIIRRQDIATKPTNVEFVVQFSSVNSSNKVSYVDVFLGEGFKFRAFSMATPTNNGDGTYDIVITTPFVHTTAAIFKSGGNDYIPTSPTLTTAKVGVDGVATYSSFAITKGEWIGIALYDFPGNLASRTYNFFQIPY